MGTCSEAFYKHWILFPTVWHLPRLSQGHNRGGQNVLKWRTFELTCWITGKRLKIDGYMLRCFWQGLNSLSIHVTFTAIVSGAYPWEAKMCLGLSWGSSAWRPLANALKLDFLSAHIDSQSASYGTVILLRLALLFWQVYPHENRSKFIEIGSLYNTRYTCASAIDCIWTRRNMHEVGCCYILAIVLGEANCALGWLQKLTHVPLAIATLLV